MGNGDLPAVVILSLALLFSLVRSSDNRIWFWSTFCHMHTLFCTHFKGKPKKNLIFDANLQTDLLAVMIMDFY